MAENKKSIIVYADWIELFESLNDAEAGLLIKHFFRYVNDLNPIAPDRITELSFIPIKQALKRDLKNWENTLNERSINGRKGNLKKYNLDIYLLFESGKFNLEEAEELAKTRKASPPDSIATKTIANVADNVNDNVNVNVINNNTPAKADDIFDFNKYLETLNQKFSRSFKVVNEKTKKQIKARLKEKYTKQDIIDAINNCVVSEFHKGNGYQYCTPEFFSRADILDRWSDITKPKQSKVNIEL